MNDTKILQLSLFWVPSGKRKRGRPRETLRRSIIREGLLMGISTLSEMTGNATHRLESYGFCPMCRLWYWRKLIPETIKDLQAPTKN
jgi:hypothetical protein